ncbi:very long chain fatty acid elongase 4-like isoform X2 [Ptychodera flava]
MAVFAQIAEFYDWMMDEGDPRVETWLLMKSPLPSALIVIGYLFTVWLSPKYMANREAFKLKPVLVVYNFALVILSFYMFYEFLVTSTLAGYSYRCQPVDYSNSPLALRMAAVCWWFFFSKIIELLDTLFFILRKKNNQVTFLHVYHHSTMIVNWWLGVKYIAGGQSFFLAMVNSFIHTVMYTYYGLAAFGPHMQKYLWWKKYMTQLQLMQFFAVMIHTGINLATDCSFPQGFNIAVVLYALSMILLFGNFYRTSYGQSKRKKKQYGEVDQNGIMENGNLLLKEE